MTAREALAALSLAACVAGAMAGCSPIADTAEPEATLQLAELLGGSDTLHARAVEPRTFEFPADHGEHPRFRTEWWYFTGALIADDGRPVGYQLTFFRSALTDTASWAPGADPSAWRTRHAWMAHFAVSDGEAESFHAAERFSRSALGLAGARAEPFRVWLGDWYAARQPATRPPPLDTELDPAVATLFPLTLNAADADVAIDLTLEAGKPIVLQGDAGLSRKGSQPGNASYYYSMTRMPTTGTITIDGVAHVVRGDSWLDREWSTSVLAEGVTGWDWFALQFDDSTELMLYQLRRDDGTADEFSAGMFVRTDGSTVPLSHEEFRLTPVRTWSERGYPTTWRLTVPALDLDLTVEAEYEAQELVLAVRYWEGMVRAQGARGSRAVRARGYLEMTGYDAPR